jgi:hypothetical protein
LVFDDEVTLEEIDSGLVLWHDQLEQDRSWTVDIVTRRGLPEFVSRARATFLKMQHLALLAPSP